MNLQSEQGYAKDVRALYRRYPFPGSSVQNYDLGHYLAELLGLGLERQQFPWSGKRLLDAGCGTGVKLRAICEMLGWTGPVTGVDFSPESLIRAQDELSSLPIAYNLAEADLLSLDLGTKFDLITCIGVLHHLAKPLLGLQRLAAHLEPDGLMALWVYNTYGCQEWLRKRELLLYLEPNPGAIEMRAALARSVWNPQYQNGNPYTETDCVDSFAHPHMLTFDALILANLLESAGLVYVDLLAPNAFRDLLEPAKISSDPKFLSRTKHFGQIERLHMYEIFVAPRDLFLLVRLI